MDAIVKVCKYVFGWAFVFVLIAWIWAPSYMSLERRIEINNRVSKRLVRLTGVEEFAEYNFTRIRAHEVYGALADVERQAIALARARALSGNKVERDLSDQTVSDEIAGEDPAQGAKFVRVQE